MHFVRQVLTNLQKNNYWLDQFNTASTTAF